ncbi:hypothetical protein AQS8620_02826 [Aquimixticola soesokkakensis]|uniref:DUF3329 domain-containing protein n=1 Tax=Aquimixticola soesokkakensis TaxID=1519096 RepID=A0A1Y5TEP2_9RHOB|nr:hypothetical protein [Aquimixticola soesokkakensis]SLN62431.1 hypothetical protein AQS8620_02826 [Aquimixticola soesokkakensis]
MFNFDLPFYRPLWLRLGIVILSLGWAIVELTTGSPGFAILFGAVGFFAAYRFFVTFDPDKEARKTTEASKDID